MPTRGGTRGGAPGVLSLISRFRPYLREERPLLAGSLASLLAAAILKLLEPWPLKVVFDHVLAPPTGVAPGLNGVSGEAVALIAAIALVLVVGLRAAADYGSTIGMALAGSRVLARVRGMVFRHLQGLSLTYHSRARAGELTVRVIGDVGLLQDVLITAVLPLLRDVVVMVGMVGLMLWVDWRLALAALAVAPLFWIRTARSGPRIRDASRAQRRREGAMAATAAETMGAIKTVQALSLEESIASSFSSQNRKSVTEGVAAKRHSAALERSVDVLTAVATGIVLALGAVLVRRGGLTPGELLVFLAYLKSGYKPVRDVAKYTARLAKAAAAGERVVEVLSQEPDVRDLPGAIQAPTLRGDVRFEGVTFGYVPGVPVLRGLDLELRAGERLALVGVSGQGKSTLAALILRLYDPSAGRVLVDGLDVRELTVESLRAQVAVVLQDGLLFAGTVRDNIACGRVGLTKQGSVEAARLAAAHDFVSALPQGYETSIGERGVMLSGGERQRIAIARAAARHAPILLLDEPTVGLDEENERAVIEALERLSVGRTCLLITHDLSLAERADRIAYLDDGRVVETGTHDELMRAGGRYARLYRLQQGAAAPFSTVGGSHAVGA